MTTVYSNSGGRGIQITKHLPVLNSIWGFLAFCAVFAASLVFVPSVAATSASLNVSRNGWQANITVTASFTSYENCSQISPVKNPFFKIVFSTFKER